MAKTVKEAAKKPEAEQNPQAPAPKPENAQSEAQRPVLRKFLKFQGVKKK